LNSLQCIVRGGLVALACFSAPLHAGLFSDPPSDWKEGGHAMPPPPREEALHGFFASSASPNRHFVDTDSLSVGDDGVVRYVLVVRTPGGAENVTFEGIRCAAGAWRLYATGRSNGEWAPARRDDWRPISDNSYDRARAALAYDHFCDGPVSPRNRAEALRGLRQGDRKVLP